MKDAFFSCILLIYQQSGLPYFKFGECAYYSWLMSITLNLSHIFVSLSHFSITYLSPIPPVQRPPLHCHMCRFRLSLWAGIGYTRAKFTMLPTININNYSTKFNLITSTTGLFSLDDLCTVYIPPNHKMKMFTWCKQ